MRYFSTPNKKKDIAQAVGCSENDFELVLLWFEMKILVQADDQAKMESVVRPKHVTDPRACSDYDGFTC